MDTTVAGFWFSVGIFVSLTVVTVVLAIGVDLMARSVRSMTRQIEEATANLNRAEEAPDKASGLQTRHESRDDSE